RRKRRRRQNARYSATGALLQLHHTSAADLCYDQEVVVVVALKRGEPRLVTSTSRRELHSRGHCSIRMLLAAPDERGLCALPDIGRARVDREPPGLRCKIEPGFAHGTHE